MLQERNSSDCGVKQANEMGRIRRSRGIYGATCQREKELGARPLSDFCGKCYHHTSYPSPPPPFSLFSNHATLHWRMLTVCEICSYVCAFPYERTDPVCGPISCFSFFLCTFFFSLRTLKGFSNSLHTRPLLFRFFVASQRILSRIYNQYFKPYVPVYILGISSQFLPFVPHRIQIRMPTY